MNNTLRNFDPYKKGFFKSSLKDSKNTGGGFRLFGKLPNRSRFSLGMASPSSSSSSLTRGSTGSKSQNMASLSRCVSPPSLQHSRSMSSIMSRSHILSIFLFLYLEVIEAKILGITGHTFNQREIKAFFSG